jgi:uncharacterized alpha-E superfamily protein
VRILRPEWNALLPNDDQLPRSLRTALDRLDAEIQKLHEKQPLPPEKTCFNRSDLTLSRCLVPVQARLRLGG